MLNCVYHFMPKRATSLQLVLPPRSGESFAARSLYDALRTAILEGRLRPGARLPSTRELALQEGYSRGTIVAAFDQLKAEGYLQGTIGSGTFVSRVLPEDLLQVKASPREKFRLRSPRMWRVSRYAHNVRLFEGYENRPIRAFRPNLPALDLFPTALWAQITARCLRRSTMQQLMGCGPLGYQPLRQAVCDYLNASRGVNCSVEQIAIVSGVQEALDLAARVLLDSGDTVCVETPGYPGAAYAFAACGAKVFSVAVDAEGLRLVELPRHAVRLVYVTPGHQFPLGVAMSLPRRLALLEWARQTGALIFEDDYDSEFRYRGRPVPALQGLDRNDQVLFAGSFSKVMFPALRLGYLVLPPALVKHIEAVKSLTNRHTSLFEQAVLAEFISEGHFARHIRRMREIYAERLSTLFECAQRELKGTLEISPIEAGLQTVGWLPEGVSGEEAARLAKLAGVDVTPIRRYGKTRGPREGLQLGFAPLRKKEIEQGVRQLAATWKNLRPSRKGRLTA